MSPAPPGYPRPFGAYLLLSPIAQGGMGDVFLASTLGVSGAVRLVVIKTLRNELSQEPGYVNRFLDEARIVIQLQHPNISQVFDVGIVDGTHFFAMEHILGANLRRLMVILTRQGVRMPSSLATFLAAEVLDGLECAHTHRHAITGEPLHVVHRDVSPQNIMISSQGEVKVIDFGLAESTLKLEHTESQVVLGKIAYMSPEQARGEDVDARSDQYSAAVLLYELLAGERFYGDRGQPQIWAVAGTGIVPDRLGEIDPAVAALLRRALAPAPADRFPSCGALAAALRGIGAARGDSGDRSALKEFLHTSASVEMETSEKTVRKLSLLALRTLPELSAPRAVAPVLTVGEQDVLTEATRLSRSAPVAPKRRSKLLVATSSALVLAVAAIAMLVVAQRPEVAPPAPPVADVAAVAPAPVIEAPVVVAPAVVEPPSPPEAPKVKKKPPAKQAASWASWSLPQKLAALRGCKEPCAQTLKSVSTRGEAVLPPLVDRCLVACNVR